MGNNPISRVDPLGDQWLNGRDLQTANDQRTAANTGITNNNSQIAQAQEQIDAINSQLSNGKISQDDANSQLSTLNGRVQDLKNCNAMLRTSITEIDNLETSDNIFTFNTVSKGTTPMLETGQQLTKDNGEKVSGTIINNDGSSASRGHEITHAWNANKFGVQYNFENHLQSEMFAYQMQYAYSSASMPGAYLNYDLIKGVTSMSQINADYVASIGIVSITGGGTQNYNQQGADLIRLGFAKFIPIYPDLWSKLKFK